MIFLIMVISLKGLGGIEETIKALEKMSDNVKCISIKKVKNGGMENAIISFDDSSDWRMSCIPEEGIDLFCSFATKQGILFKRQ